MRSNESKANLTISLEHILLPKDWNRSSIRKAEEMIASIKASGQIHPLLVRTSTVKPGYVILVDGRRRLYALRELGYREAKICIDTNEEDGKAYLISLVSNLAREDNTAYEKAITFQKLVTEYGITHDEIAAACGKSSGYISQYISALKASDELQEALKNDLIPITIFRLFSRLDKIEDKKIYDKLAEGVINRSLTFNAVENKIQAYLEKKGKTDSNKKKGAAAHRNNSPKVKIVDYSDPEIRTTMKHITKDRAVELLTYYGNEFMNATKKEERRYLEGILDGLEIASGLKVVE